MYRHGYLCLSATGRQACDDCADDCQLDGHHIGNGLFSASYHRVVALTLTTLADTMPTIVWLEPESI